MDTTTQPYIITAGIGSYKVYGERYLVADFLRAPKSAREEVDRWLVAINHPLAYEPGIPEYRFCMIVRELASGTESITE